MIFYLCNGNQLAGTQADARAIDKDYVQVDVPTDKAGLMAYVNALMDKAEPAVAAADPAPVVAPVPAPAPEASPSYAERSLKFEEAFENMPLGQQLHFAAVAIENARSRLK